MFVRKVRTGSGAVAVQVMRKSGRRGGVCWPSTLALLTPMLSWNPSRWTCDVRTQSHGNYGASLRLFHVVSRKDGCFDGKNQRSICQSRSSDGRTIGSLIPAGLKPCSARYSQSSQNVIRPKLENVYASTTMRLQLRSASLAPNNISRS